LTPEHIIFAATINVIAVGITIGFIMFCYFNCVKEVKNLTKIATGSTNNSKIKNLYMYSFIQLFTIAPFVVYSFVEHAFGYENKWAKFISMFLVNLMGAINVVVYFLFRKVSKRDLDSDRSPLRIKYGEISLEATLLNSNKSEDIPTL